MQGEQIILFLSPFFLLLCTLYVSLGESLFTVTHPLEIKTALQATMFPFRRPSLVSQ